MTRALRKMARSHSARALVLAALMLIVPRAALACPVCFGQSDSLMAQGVNMGIYFLLAVIVAVLAGFASFFVYLARRAKAFAEET